MNIRAARPDEWQRIRDLYLSLLKSDPQSFVDEFDEVSNRGEDKWIEEINKPDGQIFVAEDGNKLMGMGRINFYKELPNIPVLHKLGVLPEYRGMGVARRLVEVRENWAKEKGAKKVRLYVISDRDKTIEFSVKNGYEVVETLKDNARRKDGSSMDVVVMEKDL